MLSYVFLDHKLEQERSYHGIENKQFTWQLQVIKFNCDLKYLKNVYVSKTGTKADIHETQPLNWQEVKDAEKEYIDGGEEVIADIPLLIDSNDNITISAQENVGLEALKMEIVRFIKESQDPEDRMKLPEGWYRSD